MSVICIVLKHNCSMRLETILRSLTYKSNKRDTNTDLCRTQHFTCFILAFVVRISRYCFLFDR